MKNYGIVLKIILNFVADMIDPHVHCRDWNQWKKETIKHALNIAEKVGLSGIFDMPNTDPPINSRELVKKRLRNAKEVGSPVFYGLYVGLTSNPDQIREAVKTYRDFFPRNTDNVGVIGLKMFAGRSVGNLEIIEENKQQKVYQTLTEENYKGVLAVHCEKESLLRNKLWDPSKPETHCDARPPEAEYESIKDQIKFATNYNFPGNLHILHTSFDESVRLVNKTKKEGKIKITCGTTPHHCRLNRELMKDSERGILYKVNPPLRKAETSNKLLNLLKEGYIDFIETDHAPHRLQEKISDKYMSGFPGLLYYPHFLRFLKKEAGFQESQISNLTHNNINKIFGLNLPELNRAPDLNLQAEYEFDVYQGIRKNAN